MAKIARLALIPLTLAAAAAPAIAQADTGGQVSGTQSAALLGSVGSMKLYPFAGTQFDPLSNSVNATVAGVPVKSMGVSQMASDGLPVRDLPVYSGVMKANAVAQSTGTTMMSNDDSLAPAAQAAQAAPAAPVN